MYVAEVPGTTEVLAFEFFDAYVLSMFQICQPSVLWSHTIGYSTQTNSAIRNIAAHLQERGVFHRILSISTAYHSDQMKVVEEDYLDSDLHRLREHPYTVSSSCWWYCCCKVTPTNCRGGVCRVAVNSKDWFATRSSPKNLEGIV